MYHIQSTSSCGPDLRTVVRLGSISRRVCLHGHMKGSERRAPKATAELYSGSELLLTPDDFAELPLLRNRLPTNVVSCVFPAIHPLPG